MHKSALILLPFYFIYFVRLPQNRVINISVLLVCVLLGSAPTWMYLLNEMSVWLELLGYDGYAERSEMFLSADSFRITDWGPSRLGLFLLDVFVVFYYPKVRKYFKDDKFLEYSFALFFMGTCAYNLFLNTSHIFLRPIMYLQIFDLVMQVYTFRFLLKSKHKVMCFIFGILLFYHAIYVVLKAGLYPSVLGEMALYHFFFDYNPIFENNILHIVR